MMKIISEYQDIPDVFKKVRISMTDCMYCANMDNCQYIVSPDDCEDFEETFEHHWEMMDDIEREKYNSYDVESEDKE